MSLFAGLVRSTDMTGHSFMTWETSVSRCCARNKICSDNEVNVKRERLTQIVLVIVGLLNLAIIYFLYMDLRHSSWLLERKNESRCF